MVLKFKVSNIKWGFTTKPQPPKSIEFEVDEDEMGDKCIEDFVHESVEWSGMSAESYKFAITGSVRP